MMTFQFLLLEAEHAVLGTEMVKNGNRYVYQHLKRYCSKLDTLPAIEVKIIDDKFVSVARHQYLVIARELKHTCIRAVIRGSNVGNVKLWNVKGILKLIPRDVLENEGDVAVEDAWHVFFFRASPLPELAKEIEFRFHSFLEISLNNILCYDYLPSIESNFDAAEACFEIKFPTPRLNHDWSRRFLEFCNSIHYQLIEIETYQGYRWKM